MPRREERKRARDIYTALKLAHNSFFCFTRAARSSLAAELRASVFTPYRYIYLWGNSQKSSTYGGLKIGQHLFKKAQVVDAFFIFSHISKYKEKVMYYLSLRHSFFKVKFLKKMIKVSSSLNLGYLDQKRLTQSFKKETENGKKELSVAFSKIKKCS